MVDFGSVNYINYIYDASGIKLGQKIYESNTIVKETLYIGEFVYEGDGVNSPELQFIQHEEGRVVPELSTWEYQYSIKDHLGNSRVTFTTAPNEIEYYGTMESEFSPEEEAIFSNLASTRVQDANLNATPALLSPDVADESVYLDASTGKIIGPAITLTVGKNDIIDLGVYGKFESQGSFSNTAVGGFMAALTSTLESTITLGEGYVAQEIIDDAFNAIGTYGGSETDRPRAYLNYLYFDTNFNLHDEGFDRIDVSAGFPSGTPTSVTWDHMSLSINADIDGFLYIWISNESSGSEVWFDELLIDHTKSSIIQTDDYYPFGLSMATSYQRVDALNNKFKYNGKELQSDLDLNWYDYGARMYDAALGRWHVVDPSADKYYDLSPYTYVANNPVLMSDPDGRDPIDPRTGREYAISLTSASIVAIGYQASSKTDQRLLDKASPNLFYQQFFLNPLYDRHAPQPIFGNVAAQSQSRLGVNLNSGITPPTLKGFREAAKTGHYAFADNVIPDIGLNGDFDPIESFNIVNVEDNMITQISNLQLNKESGEYELSSTTSFDIQKGEVKTEEKKTLFGGTKTVKYREVTVTETIQKYENNQAVGDPSKRVIKRRENLDEDDKQ
jgi:RHS repeat-associated protein